MRAADGSGTASVLFTDLVGSTELLARLGDLRYDEVRREHNPGDGPADHQLLDLLGAVEEVVDNLAATARDAG